MPIRSAQSVLDQYYAVRDDLLSGKLASYSIGDRNVTLLDMSALESVIQQYEAIVVRQENGVVLADMSGPSNQGAPFTTRTTLPYP
jgi:hypothetical protein